jgi:hypothetical protein
MARIKLLISNPELRRFEKFVETETARIITVALNKMDRVLFAEAERLADIVRSSPEFAALKTPALIGRFGFTPNEVARLDNLFSVIAPNRDNEVTNVNKVLVGKKRSAILNWVDFEQLKKHQVAQHPLTKLNVQTNTFQVQQIVSWIEWWEEGVTVRGHVFSPQGTIFSRSGEGIMQTRSGSLFALRPTRIFAKTGEQGQGIRDNLKRSFISLVRKVR